MSEGWTGADIEAMCKKAVLLAMEECLQKDERPDFSRCKITSRHFEQAIELGTSRITSYNVCYTKLLRRLHERCKHPGKVFLDIDLPHGRNPRNNFV